MAGNFFHKIEETVTGHKTSDTHAAVQDPNAPTSDGFVPASGGFYNPGIEGNKSSAGGVTSSSTAGMDTNNAPESGPISRSEESHTGDSAHDTGSLGSSTGGTHHGQRGITHTSTEGTSVSAGSGSGSTSTSTGTSSSSGDVFSSDPTSAGGLTSKKTHGTTESGLGSGTGGVFSSDPTSASQSSTSHGSSGLSSSTEQTAISGTRDNVPATSSTTGSSSTTGRTFAETQALEGEAGKLEGAGALNTSDTLRGRLHGQHTTAAEEYGA